MSVVVIKTAVLENYAAHQSGFTGEYYWKNKPGSTYIVEGIAIDDIGEVVDLVTTPDCDVYRETVDEIFEAADDYESDFVKSQKEYDLGDTIYLDSVIRRGKNGDLFLKRGYIVGSWVEGEYAELKGKFCGWVDNLTTGECVMAIKGDKREPIEKEAA